MQSQKLKELEVVGSRKEALALGDKNAAAARSQASCAEGAAAKQQSKRPGSRYPQGESIQKPLEAHGFLTKYYGSSRPFGFSFFDYL